MCEMDYKGRAGLRDMTERDTSLAARDELARTPRRLWRPTRPQLRAEIDRRLEKA
jgi:hypothetical protein